MSKYGDILFLSDLHLADGGPRDDFHADHDLCHLMWTCRHGPIVLAGDNAETWQIDDIKDIERAHPEVCEAIEKWVTVVVRGNHDGKLEQFCGHKLHDAVIIDNIMVMHGHRFDLFNSGRLRFIGRGATWLAGRAELLHRDADVWLAQAAHWLLRRGRYSSKVNYMRHALKYLDADPALRGIVLGHTHKIDVQRGFLAQGCYWNCGTWTQGRRDHVLVPIEDPECKIEILEAT